ncbi:hypothetical protein E2C01_007626 [Portunus trituberculatus]|uniref:Uncharacterized protein n=1 Tax=Portunus trituberculatus TaxID=210409 RepID=A0A5B7CZH6_PORTR|nr:hypothetical protein [Portunus trituberculatus]
MRRRAQQAPSLVHRDTSGTQNHHAPSPSFAGRAERGGEGQALTDGRGKLESQRKEGPKSLPPPTMTRAQRQKEHNGGRPG